MTQIDPTASPDWTAERDDGISPIVLTLLGPMRVTGPDGEDLTPSSKRARAMIAMIALSQRGERGRTWLQARLWGDRCADQASASMRQEVSKLRKVLPAEYFTVTNDRIALRNVAVDVLEYLYSGSVSGSFLAAEPPELLEGLEIRDEAFEEWLRAERESWSGRLTALNSADVQPAAPEHPGQATGALVATAPESAADEADETVRGFAPPTLGILPCIVRPSCPQLSAIGDLACNLLSKLLLENRTVGVFDFRDLSPEFADHTSFAGKPEGGPDLLASFRLSRLGDMVEVAVSVRRVENGRLVWTQSFSYDAADGDVFDTHRVGEFVNQTAETIESWLLKEQPNDIRNASSLILSAAHRIFCISPTDLSLADEQLQESFALDPSPVQLAWMAMLECIREGEGAGEPGELAVRRERVASLTAQALQLDRGNSLALGLLGHANAFIMRDYDLASELIDDAIKINRHRAAGWFAKAMLLLYTGTRREGYQAALRGRSLARYSPYVYWYNASCGIGAALAGEHKDAVRYARLVLRQRPDFKPALRHLFASYAVLGDFDAARHTLSHLTTLEPTFTPELLASANYPMPSADSISLIRSGFDMAKPSLPSAP